MRHTHLKPIAAALALAFALPALADKQLGEITVSGGRAVGAKPQLRDEIVATESIGARELEKTLADVAKELRYQYLLGYTPSEPIEKDQPEWRSIRVVLSKPGVRVRARDGYTTD